MHVFSPHSAYDTAMTDPAASAPAAFSVMTPRRQALFLERLAECGQVRVACAVAGVSAQTAYRVRRRDAGFAHAWDAALLAARDHATAVLTDRAPGGVEEVVFYRGEEVGRRRRYDTRLLLAHLAGLDRMAERAGCATALAALDDGIVALHRGEALAAVPQPVSVPPARSEAAAAGGAGSTLDRIAALANPPLAKCFVRLDVRRPG